MRPDWRAPKAHLLIMAFFSFIQFFWFYSQETYTQHGIIYEDYQQSWEPRVSAKGVSTRLMRNKAFSWAVGFRIGIIGVSDRVCKLRSYVDKRNSVSVSVTSSLPKCKENASREMYYRGDNLDVPANGSSKYW